MATPATGTITAIDPVVRAAMLPGELRDLLERVDPTGEEVAHSTASAGGYDLGTLSAFNMREHEGVRFLGTNGLYLAPGLIYTSAATTHLNLDGPVALTTRAGLRVTGRLFPHILVDALTGRHVSALLEHPALADPRLTMESSGYDKFVVVKSRGGAKAPTGDPTDNAFTVILPQLLEDIDIASPS